jgi:hypothetical protein
MEHEAWTWKLWSKHELNDIWNMIWSIWHET